MPVSDLLGHLENAVMAIMWRIPRATVREVHEELSSTRNIAYTTVLTVMGNLHNKGLLDKIAEVRAHTYSATLTEQEFLERECQRAVSSLLDRFGDLAVASFINLSRPISPELTEILRQHGLVQPDADDRPTPDGSAATIEGSD